jgi:hypothetical protein
MPCRTSGRAGRGQSVHGGSCAFAEFAAGHTRGAYLVGSIRSAELARSRKDTTSPVTVAVSRQRAVSAAHAALAVGPA